MKANLINTDIMASSDGSTLTFGRLPDSSYGSCLIKLQWKKLYKEPSQQPHGLSESGHLISFVEQSKSLLGEAEMTIGETWEDANWGTQIVVIGRVSGPIYLLFFKKPNPFE